MSYGSRTGQFAQINLSNNVSAQAQYLTNGLQIQITSGGSNLPPSAPVLIAPADNDTVSISSPISFHWNSSTDPDNDPITYSLRIFGSGVDTTIAGLSDTTTQFNGSGTLQPGNSYQWNVTASDGNLSTVSATWNFFVSSPTNIDDEQIANMIPTEYSLSQNYPNPFNPSTTIRYSVPSRSTVVLKIYDILGGEVSTLVNEEKDAGFYELTIDASGLASGIYFYRLQAGSLNQTKKMILLR
ncbi:MAG: T9SS type A sorting domain-containing protein [Bacteroidales bacterium]|nr:T9SS type A sorting domain-containing protein [Bacteroidales bacterium]